MNDSVEMSHKMSFKKTNLPGKSLGKRTMNLRWLVTKRRTREDHKLNYFLTSEGFESRSSGFYVLD